MKRDYLDLRNVPSYSTILSPGKLSSLTKGVFTQFRGHYLFTYFSIRETGPFNQGRYEKFHKYVGFEPTFFQRLLKKSVIGCDANYSNKINSYIK